MNNLYKKIIFIVLSIGALAAAYFLIVKPTNEETATIKSETASRRDYYNSLLEKEANRQQYLDDTEAYKVMYQAKLDEFPSNWKQEYQIEFIEGVRKNENITYDVESLGMSQPASYYSIGGSFSEGLLSEEAQPESTGYECFRTTLNLSYMGSYDGIKDFMDYVASFPYRMTIDNVSIAYSEGSEETGEEGEYKGSMALYAYAVSGNGRDEQFDIDLNEVETGIDNIFIGGEGVANVSKYLADNGEAIKTDYDIMIAVNPADSDTSGKMVSLASGSNRVTSSKNETESVSIKVTKGDDGTYTVEYGIGADKETQSFDPGEDLTLLVQSSDLKDASDVNTINLSLDNSTDKTLYVKVADDVSANRVKVTNRAGSVVVYR